MTFCFRKFEIVHTIIISSFPNGERRLQGVNEAALKLTNSQRHPPHVSIRLSKRSLLRKIYFRSYSNCLGRLINLIEREGKDDLGKSPM